jgi:signal transduction histidine kinase
MIGNAGGVPMEMIADCPFAATLAMRLRGSRDDLTRRWLDRISARVALHPNRVFPSEELLDHVPLLIDGVADYLENPAGAVTGDIPVVAKAMELGDLRYAQGFDEHELLKEYELFGSILYAFLSRTADDIDVPCTRRELRNVESVRGVLDNLTELSRLGTSDSRHQRHVSLPAAAAEAVRQVREAARSLRVEIRLGKLPDIEVNAAVVELALSNLLSNAIKYADRGKDISWVDVTAEIHSDGEADVGDQIIVKVTDNGIGIPEGQRAHLFERFFRAHTMTSPSVEGTGLGLSIVRETVEAVGGRAWAEFPTGGSLFAFALPCRRAEDRTAINSDAE